MATGPRGVMCAVPLRLAGRVQNKGFDIMKAAENSAVRSATTSPSAVTGWSTMTAQVVPVASVAGGVDKLQEAKLDGVNGDGEEPLHGRVEPVEKGSLVGSFQGLAHRLGVWNAGEVDRQPLKWA